MRASETDAVLLFERWLSSIATRHPDKVMRHYAANPLVTGPTLPGTRSGRQPVRDYWVHFLATEPQFTHRSRTVLAGCGTFVDRGEYVLTHRNPQRGAPDVSVSVAYMMVYELRDGNWMVTVDQGSVIDPKNTVNAETLTAQGLGRTAVAGYVQRAPQLAMQKAPKAAAAPKLPAERKAPPAQTALVVPEPQPAPALGLVSATPKSPPPAAVPAPKVAAPAPAKAAIKAAPVPAVQKVVRAPAPLPATPRPAPVSIAAKSATPAITVEPKAEAWSPWIDHKAGRD